MIPNGLVSTSSGADIEAQCPAEINWAGRSEQL